MPEPRHRDGVRDHEIAAVGADHRIAKLAAEQHGVVARRQLLSAGVSAEMIRTRLAARRLIPLHRGVYAVGHDRLTLQGRWLAAVLAAGPSAVLSHREAAALHGLRPSSRPATDVTTTTRRRIPGAHVHRVSRLDVADRTTVAGIPVTTVARTLVDLADVLPPARLRKAFEEAERSHRLDVRAIEHVLRRVSGRNGGGPSRTRTALAELATAGTSLTRSELEERFLALLAAHGLPRPATNATLGGMEVDAVWRAERVVVELDGWAFHRTRDAFERDRARSVELAAEGWTVLRLTHAQVAGRPAWTAERVRRALRPRREPASRGR